MLIGSLYVFFNLVQQLMALWLIRNRFRCFNSGTWADLCPGKDAINKCVYERAGMELLTRVHWGFALEFSSDTIILLLCKWRAGYYFISKAEYLQYANHSVLAASLNAGATLGPIWSGAACYGLIKALWPSVLHIEPSTAAMKRQAFGGLWKIFDT